jgi:hypothetical protein
VSEEDENPRNVWLARGAYLALAAVLVFGLARRLPLRRAPVPVEPERSAAEIFGTEPAPLPLTVSPSAPRIVLWCKVRAVLEHKCQRCHSSPPRNGAPFPLLTYADTQREHPIGSGHPLFERMSHALRYRIMPPTALPLEPPVLPLETAERDALLVWLEEGGLALGGESCGAQRADQ